MAAASALPSAFAVPHCRRTRRPPACLAVIHRRLHCPCCDLLFGQRARIGRRPQRGEQFRLDQRPIDEERVVQVHPERDRPAADQGHLDAGPVFVGRVLDDRPALQVRLFLLVEHQPIAGLPDRAFDDVADLDLALAFAREVQADGLLLRVVGQRQRFQGAAELVLDHRVLEAQPLHFVQLHAANAFGAPQVEDFDFDAAVFARLVSALRRR